MFDVRWMWLWTLPLMTLGATPETPAPQPKPEPVKFSYKEPGCNPVKELQCVCVGNAGAAAPSLVEIGLDPSQLSTTGAPCIQGDFDKDGEPDYAFPGKSYASCNGSAPVRVIFTRRGQVREVTPLPREMSCFNLYPPRSKRGPYGEPTTKRQGLVDWGEGNSTWVFLFDGKEWHATSYASEKG